MGHCIWTGEQSARSDLGLSEPLNWNLTDKAGRRINRGIYLYRATITTDNANYVSASRKLAVKAQSSKIAATSTTQWLEHESIESTHIISS
jgi:hypothetical protein